MLNIDFSKTNQLEKEIHDILIKSFQDNINLTITNAALLCGVSPSKISKFVRKLGFRTYKEYKQYFSLDTPGKNINKHILSESDRILNFLNNFETDVIDSFLELFNLYGKVILFGLGPSFICAEYFAYRLQIFTNKFIIATNETRLINNTADKDTLVIVISATGIFRSFKSICDYSIKNGNELLFLIEEYRHLEELQDFKLFYLTNTTQCPLLKPFEKSRTLFFIFFEEVIHKIINTKKVD